MKIFEKEFLLFHSLAVYNTFYQGYMIFLNPFFFEYAGFGVNEPRLINYIFMIYTFALSVLPIFFFVVLIQYLHSFVFLSTICCISQLK